MNKLELYTRTANNIEIERLERNMSQQEMADYLEMSLSSYKRMINGECMKLEYYVIYKIFKLTGKFGFELANDAVDIDFVKELRHLSTSQKKFISSIIDIEKSMVKSKKSAYNIPLIIMTGDMKDGMYDDSMNIKQYDTDNPLATCAVLVTSNHLHPVYHKGDILLVRQEPPRDGDTAIFIDKVEDRVYIRKYKQTNPCQLIPINDYGNTIYISQDNEDEMNRWIKFGYVVTKCR